MIAAEHPTQPNFLLVSDNAQEAALVLKVLNKAKVMNRVDVLGEGDEILDFLFRSGRFKNLPALPAETLILLSLTLGSISSTEVLRKIKGNERTRGFPIILLASSQDDRGVMEGYKLGANACIVQPIDMAKLVEAVGELRLGWLLQSEEAVKMRSRSTSLLSSGDKASERLSL